MKLSKAMQAALDNFDETAQGHGWMKDQGTGERVTQAETEYKEAKAKLTALILQQQSRLKSAQDRYNKLAGEQHGN